jgi:hypothetical protein
MTPEQAEELYYCFEIGLLLDDREERELLEEHNPLLLEAYRALAKLAGK